ncbi:MAG TPA: RidA family protein [Sphingobium sp.]|uniref:RidA family protein n=1 Tax=Sphingobium sp. TaxID=1912891 RepID=UPI002ED3A2BE
MKKPFFATASLLGLLPSAALHAAEITRHRGAPESPILTGVTIPPGATWLILSGQVPAPLDPAKPANDPAAYGDTQAQATSIFRKIDAALKAQGFTLGDVVKLTVFLVGDPHLGGKQDFAGFQTAYRQFFGTAEQPNIVARSTVQVAGLANPGFLVEIEATAAKQP